MKIRNSYVATLLLAGLAMAAGAQQFPPGLPPVPSNMQLYVAILSPQFIPAVEATFMEDGDILIGVSHGNVAKAFPASDLGQHGSVNDEMPNGPGSVTPIEVTWCGTCNTGAVFIARFRGRILHFEYDSWYPGMKFTWIRKPEAVGNSLREKRSPGRARAPI